MAQVNRDLKSLDELAALLARKATELPAAYAAAMDESAKLVQAEAKAELGTYQSRVGPFNAWSALAESTLAHKEADTPLYETGELQNAIHEHSGVNFFEVGVPSWPTASGKSDIGIIAEVQELGNSRIPPRPFLGPALYKNADKIAAILTAGIGAVFSGASVRSMIRGAKK